MVSALTLSFALRWADFYAANQIDNSGRFIGVLYGINITAAVIAIALLLRSRKMTMPVSLRNRLSNWRQRVQDRMPTAPGGSNGGGA